MKRVMAMGAAAWFLGAASNADPYADAMQQAWSLLEAQQQPARAAPLFEAALGQAAGAADARAARAGLGASWARAGWQAGEPADAARGLALVREVLADPAATPEERAQCFEIVAESQSRAGRYEDARSAHESVARMEGAPVRRVVRAWIGAAQAEYERGRYAPAREACERALALLDAGGGLNAAQRATLRWDAYRGLGAAWSAEGRFQEAEAVYQAVSTADWADAKVRSAARLQAAHAAYEAGRYADACVAYRALWPALGGAARRLVVQRLDTIYRMQRNQADALLAAGRYAEARAEYGRLLHMEGVEAHHQAAARLGLGHAWMAEKKYREAATEYEAALAIQGASWPDRGRAQLGLAQVRAAEGRAAEARRAFEQLLAMKNVAESDLDAARDGMKAP